MLAGMRQVVQYLGRSDRGVLVNTEHISVVSCGRKSADAPAKSADEGAMRRPRMASCLAAAPRVSIPLFGADLSRGDSPKVGAHASTLAARAQAVRALCRQHALGALCARAPVTLRST